MTSEASILTRDLEPLKQDTQIKKFKKHNPNTTWKDTVGAQLRNSRFHFSSTYYAPVPPQELASSIALFPVPEGETVIVPT